MFRPSMSALAALLLALPLQAQIARVTASFSPVRGAPAVARIVSPTAPSPLAPSPLPAASALVPALSLPASLTALDVVIPDAARPAAPLEDWASRFDFQPGEQFFDGGRALRSEAGATFAYAPKRGGAVRVHIVERAPLAETKAVPGTEGLSGATLLDALHAISGKGHRERAYNEASDYLFSTADQVAINGVRGVVDAYSGVFVPGTSKDGVDYPETGDANGDGFADKDGMNVEHTVPQSVFKQALPMRSDLHHLMATFVHPNWVRGHLPFGEVRGRPDYENRAGAKRGDGVFEPPDAVKGRVARGLLYFRARYGDSRLLGRVWSVFWNRQIELLMDWNRRFPPDAFESRRNDLLEAYQGNRNPFIDDHLLADRVGADAFRVDPPSRGGSRFRLYGRRFSRR